MKIVIKSLPLLKRLVKLPLWKVNHTSHYEYPTGLSAANTNSKRVFSTTSHCAVFKWIILNDDGHQNPHSGYYIVLPNVPNENSENNIFLEDFELKKGWPPLSKGTPEEFYQAVVKLVLEMGATFWHHVEMLEKEMKQKSTMTFDKVLSPLLIDDHEVLYAVQSLHLKMMTDWPNCDGMDWHNDFEAVFKFYIDEFNERMFKTQTIMDAVRKIPEAELEKLGPWEKRLVQWLKLNWQLQGCEPDPTNNKKDRKQQETQKEFFARIAHSGLKYSVLLLHDPDFGNVSVTIRDRSKLRHAPPHILRMLAMEHGTDTDPDKGPWTACTNSGTIFELLKYSSAREEKKHLWDAWISRASFSARDPMLNNSMNIEHLRMYCQAYAQILGYKSPAHHQLSAKMIGNPETLREFIASLYHRFRPVVTQRFDDWRKYAEEQEDLPFGQLSPSDLFYICRREALHCHSVEPLELMKHFPVWPTFEKLLTLFRMIFGIEFRDITEKSSSSLERCHPSVRIYEVIDKPSNEHLGRFYVDPFARENKKNCDGWHPHLWRFKKESCGWDKLVWLVGGAEEIDPNTGQPGLLHYEQLEELLSCFGRIIQAFLSRSPYQQLLSPHTMVGSESDADGFLATFVKFFIYKPNLLMALSSPHVETGQLLSAQKAQDAALAFARGTFWDTWRCLFWADYDLSLYEMEDQQDKFWLDLYKEMYAEYFPFPLEKNNFQPCSFIPIFTPHYNICMYYQSLWCETLALDVHQTFDNEGDFLSTGNRLKTTWLNHGALKSQWEMYNEFQGREPNILAISNFHDPIPPNALESGRMEGKKLVYLK